MKEIWKDIPNYEGLYQASNYGQIKSLAKKYGNNGYHKQRILKPGKDKDGYLHILLSKNNVRRYTTVHKLVLETFIGPCPPGMQCRHLNENPKNNKSDNLKWGTPKENKADSIKHGTSRRGSKHGSSKLNNNKIRKIRKLHLEGKSNTEIAKIFDITQSNVSYIINNKTWRHIK